MIMLPEAFRLTIITAFLCHGGCAGDIGHSKMLAVRKSIERLSNKYPSSLCTNSELAKIQTAFGGQEHFFTASLRKPLTKKLLQR
ncbi:MAG: hypothetical protein CSA33_05895 [Desulfobulbus propionicus]|nr:MAG: hypothetical protein CSA33_05895 [Desulfobulbus propionicus]